MHFLKNSKKILDFNNYIILTINDDVSTRNSVFAPLRVPYELPLRVPYELPLRVPPELLKIDYF